MNMLRSGLRLRARIILAFALGGLFLSVLLSTINTAMPSRQKRSVHARPRPRAAPVTTATLTIPEDYSQPMHRARLCFFEVIQGLVIP